MIRVLLLLAALLAMASAIRAGDDASPPEGPPQPVGRILLFPTVVKNFPASAAQPVERAAIRGMEAVGAVVEPIRIDTINATSWREDWTLRAMRETVERDAAGFALLELAEDTTSTTGTQATLTVWNRRYHRIEVGSGGVATSAHAPVKMNLRIARLLEGLKNTERIGAHLRSGFETPVASKSASKDPLDLTLLLSRRLASAEASAKRAGGEAIATWSYIFEQTRRMAALGKQEYALIVFEGAFANSGGRPPIRVARNATYKQRIESWESLLADLVHLRAVNSFSKDLAFFLETHRKAITLLTDGKEKEAAQLLDTYRVDMMIVWEEARQEQATEHATLKAAQGS